MDAQDAISTLSRQRLAPTTCLPRETREEEKTGERERESGGEREREREREREDKNFGEHVERVGARNEQEGLRSEVVCGHF